MYIKNKIELSIVLGSYNRRKFIEKTIESIRENGIKRSYEIIVIDGGSNDGTIEYLIEQKDIIKIIQHNHGIWQGKKLNRRSWGYFMNLGFKIAQGRYICMISDDCLVPKNVIENSLKIIQEKQNNGTKIGGLAFYFRDWPNEKKYKIHYTYGNLLTINHGIFIKEALESVGYADEESFQFYSADGDLSIRIWQKGYLILKDKNCFVEHHIHAPSRRTHSNKKQYEKDVNAGLNRWRKLIGDNSKLGYWEKIDIEDPYKTVEKFPKGSAKEVLREYLHKLKNKINI